MQECFYYSVVCAKVFNIFFVKKSTDFLSDCGRMKLRVIKFHLNLVDYKKHYSFINSLMALTYCVIKDQCDKMIRHLMLLYLGE